MQTEKWQTVLCFWCREPRGDRSLAEPGDDRTEVICDYIPCRRCQHERSQGIFIAEISESPRSIGQPSIQDGLPGGSVDVANTGVKAPPVYPTGNWLVFDPDGLRETFPDVIAEVAEAQRQLLFGEDLYQHFFPSQLLSQLEVDRMIDDQGGLQ